ncbi:5-methyltetrahydropteroyltriglutamate--homocysteine S-methyltransferase [Texcoconibacillus texcoconensis]|uniref:5-methyltetrahydropteroyltriglutamate--homocysteine methyltransferase n=1 Tax=Texcoconibacillus texcoconensis TaxID=1095777 RepID=A0A840QNC9_9BACI|nr:5-methyltetrahydropteroyltriglutamate--homocysteine S-methyltransferase [Texcoconibacillus texcoconensis]MBB5172850.1 5-methyltetrahydropteroyltriglutamate--homocysteine methyltransferase [Texcoconibacillus texcoconensis]
MPIKTSIQGFPRIGENREWKRLLEFYWKNEIDGCTFEKEMKDIRLNLLQKQQNAGVGLIPTGDFTYYDHVLDTAYMFNLIPSRFQNEPFASGRDLYFALARGTKHAEACEMTKWFNTNYHYIVPEIEDTWIPKVLYNKPLADYLEAKQELGIQGKPVLIGPYSFLSLAKGYDDEQFERYLDILISLYAKVIAELTEAGASYIQIDEPWLVHSISDKDFQLVQAAYNKLTNLVPDAKLLLQTYFESVSHYEKIIQLPVAGIGLDFVYDKGKHLSYIEQFGFPKDKVLALGIIDGRNIWKTDLDKTWELIRSIQTKLSDHTIWFQTSCSLLHVPMSLSYETTLPKSLKEGLAFAEEKIEELNLLKDHLTSNTHTSQQWESHQSSLHSFKKAYQSTDESVFPNYKAMRSQSFSERNALQKEKFQLPLLPTTTIGSFPQTLDMRRARTAFRKGEQTQEKYDQLVKDKIKHWIDVQEELDLDVFVHGEFERNDMVEFFGEKLNGFAVTINGWVQSYGSRCVKPPIIYSDVAFDEPMTVKETAYAQSLTQKPVKGMLTGPVTILNWSFERTDLPKHVVANQIAHSLTKEIEELEQSEVEMIQVDEPALREGLPLKKEDHTAYLDWAVNAFRLTTEKVKPTTQVHTHMCYSEFHDIIDSINAMDADVISIETSSSHGELIKIFEKHVYDKGIGLGVYDIHSPRIPTVEEMVDIIHESLDTLPSSLFWVNPDCGLKTRTEEETVSALTNMVKAARIARNNLTSPLIK